MTKVADFFDMRDLGRIRHARLMRLCFWLISVVALTLFTFLLSFIGPDGYAAYRVCIFVSLAFYLGTMATVFFHSERRVTPLFLFMAAFYLVRNSQLLLFALGINFNAYSILHLQGYLKDAIILTSVCNLWAGLAAVFATVPAGEHVRRLTAVEDSCDRARMRRVLGIGCAVTGLAAFVLAVLRLVFLLLYGVAKAQTLGAQIPGIFRFAESLFLPLCLAMGAFFYGKKLAYLTLGAAAGYCLLTALGSDYATGAAGIVTVLFLLCFFEKNTKKRLRMVLIALAVCLLLPFLAQSSYMIRERVSLGSLSFGSFWIGGIRVIGDSCVSLLAMLNIVPDSEHCLLGGGYLCSILRGALPLELDPSGTLERLTANAQIYEKWSAMYFGWATGGVGFSTDAEGYVNFGWYAFLPVFLLVLVLAFFLNRYRWYGEDAIFPKYAACVLLLAGLALPGKDCAGVWRTLVFGVLLLSLLLRRTCRPMPDDASATPESESA